MRRPGETRCLLERSEALNLGAQSGALGEDQGLVVINRRNKGTPEHPILIRRGDEWGSNGGFGSSGQSCGSTHVSASSTAGTSSGLVTIGTASGQCVKSWGRHRESPLGCR